MESGVQRVNSRKRAKRTVRENVREREKVLMLLCVTPRISYKNVHIYIYIYIYILSIQWQEISHTSQNISWKIIIINVKC